jgi:hypothetical protein
VEKRSRIIGECDIGQRAQVVGARAVYYWFIAPTELSARPITAVMVAMIALTPADCVFQITNLVSVEAVLYRNICP